VLLVCPNVPLDFNSSFTHPTCTGHVLAMARRSFFTGLFSSNELFFCELMSWLMFTTAVYCRNYDTRDTAKSLSYFLFVHFPGVRRSPFVRSGISASNIICHLHKRPSRQNMRSNGRPETSPVQVRCKSGASPVQVRCKSGASGVTFKKTAQVRCTHNQRGQIR
jgi:hypothetical protein